MQSAAPRKRRWAALVAGLTSIPLAATFAAAPALAAAPAVAITPKATKTIAIAEKVTLKATKRSKGPKGAITWTSSNTSIARVSSKGVVTGKRAGSVTIRAAVKGANTQASRQVKVAKPASSVKLRTRSVALATGDARTLKVTFSPAGTKSPLVWRSSDTSVATVTSAGRVRAVGNGQATIAVSIKGKRDKPSRARIRVSDTGGGGVFGSRRVRAKDISPNQPAVTLREGERFQVRVTWKPRRTTNKRLTYTSFDPQIARISRTGLITAVKQGRAEIQLKTADGSGKKAKVVVTVLPVVATAISAGQTAIGLANGTTAQLNITFTPANTTNKRLTYTTSNAAVATVSDSGLITAIKQGSARVTARTTDGSNKTATVNVAVNPVRARSMTASVSKAKIEMEESIKIQSTIAPANATVKALKYTLVDPLLEDAEALDAEAYDGPHAVTVSDTGVVKGLARGPALIKVETVDGSNLVKLVKLKVDWKAEDKTGMRVFSTNDGEKDDIQSFRRFLLYTNEMDVESIVLSSSNFHAAGMPERVIDGVTYPPIPPDSWVPERWIDDLTAQYEEIYPNLVVHDPNYPTPDGIRAAIAMGNVGYSGEVEASTEGSLMIKEALLDNDPRVVQFQVWGGTNTFARALMDIEEDYFHRGTWQGRDLTTGTYTNAVYTRGEFKFKDANGNNDPAKWAEWEAVVQKVNAKANLYIILGQDILYGTYVEKYWPGITSIYDNHTWSFMAYQALQQGSYFTNWGFRGDFLTEHIIRGHGTLMGNYVQYGTDIILPDHGDNAQDGRHNKAEDPAYAPWTFLDEFGIERRAQKNTRLARGDMMSEGDTPAFLAAIDRGLRFEENPTWGGWAGRQSVGDRPTEFTNGGYDYSPYPYRPLDDPIASAAQAPWGWQRRHSGSRWTPAMQTDFAARADWAVTPNYEGGNHNPRINVVGGNNRTAVAGQRVLLSARTSDPDNDRVDIRWWHYGEADTYKERSADGQLADSYSSPAATGPAPVFVKPYHNAAAYDAAVFIPSDAQPGDTIHIIAEATDNGRERGKDHSLKYYERVVITVEEASPVKLTPVEPVTSGTWDAASETFTFNGTGAGFTQAFSATPGFGNINVGTGFGATTTVNGSSDTSVFTVTGSGTTATVTPVGPGTATLNATMTINGRNSVISIRIKVAP